MENARFSKQIQHLIISIQKVFSKEHYIKLVKLNDNERILKAARDKKKKRW